MERKTHAIFVHRERKGKNQKKVNLQQGGAAASFFRVFSC
jgi:hypothetical protein